MHVCTVNQRTHLIVSGVHENLIDNLKKSWDVGDLLVHHALVHRVPHPHGSGNLLDTADVRIGSFEDMFQLRELR